MANPNRVRALIGAFAQANHTQFNRADGAGYEFVADIVLDARSEESAGRGAADGRVPFLARARSAAPRPRRSRPCAASPAAPSLSRDVHDIVARTLAESWRLRCWRIDNAGASRARYPAMSETQPAKARKRVKALLLSDRIDTSNLEHDGVVSTAPLTSSSAKTGS